jgi:hypothetical protein
MYSSLLLSTIVAVGVRFVIALAFSRGFRDSHNDIIVSLTRKSDAAKIIFGDKRGFKTRAKRSRNLKIRTENPEANHVGSWIAHC